MWGHKQRRSGAGDYGIICKNHSMVEWVNCNFCHKYTSDFVIVANNRLKNVICRDCFNKHFLK